MTTVEEVTESKEAPAGKLMVSCGVKFGHAK